MPTHEVTEADVGQRLDRFLRARLGEHSRAFVQKLIEAGRITVDGHASKASYKVRAGNVIDVEIPPPRPLEAQPEALPLDVLYEDDDLIVLNKPAGMVVHPAAGNPSGTLVNALLHHCRSQLSCIGGVERPGIVHRLDKGTTGCIVIAKSEIAHQSLVVQFKSHMVVKVYRAICWGRFERLSGTIETLIGRSATNRKKMSARVAKGRAAHTDYHILRQFDDHALVELRIHTGRTHQIRVHMAHIGHPIVGDATYGRARHTDNSVARPLLHAYKLGFTHPRTGTPMEFSAPMPDDMKRYE
jgi:23S rRNA pseudouridine1911/1915/1917 synthase